MDPRFIPESLPEGTKQINSEQAHILCDKGDEVTLYWYRGHSLGWGKMYGAIMPNQVKRVIDGGYLCINQYEYWQHFGYDVEFPALDRTKDNLLEFFGNKITIHFDPDFWGDGNTPVHQWSVLEPTGNHYWRVVFGEFVKPDVEDKVKDFVANYYTEIAAKAMPDFKFNFKFQSQG